MGFNEAKKKALRCLASGAIRHEARGNIDIKNLLLTGDISAEQLAEILARASGDHYESRTHHFDDSIKIHIVKTTHSGKVWYIKWYFVEPNCVFISVHH